MSEVPERIWAWRFNSSNSDDLIKGGWTDISDHKVVEYVRADIFTLLQLQENPEKVESLQVRIERLRDALVQVNKCCDGLMASSSVIESIVIPALAEDRKHD